MLVDKKRVDYALKWAHQSNFLAKYLYAPIGKLFLHLFAKLNLPLYFVAYLKLIFSIIAACVIIFYPSLLWVAAIIIILAGVMDLCDGAWATYKGKSSLYGTWLEEMNGLLSFLVIFFAGAYSTFLSSHDYRIWVLFGFAVFSFMAMNYAASLVAHLEEVFKIKENLADIFKNTLSRKTKINPEYISFSFDYQWTIIALFTLFNLFTAIFWIYIVIGTIRWAAKYFVLYRKN